MNIDIVITIFWWL